MWSVTGTVADVNAALAAVAFQDGDQTFGFVVPVPSTVDRSTSNREVTSDWPGTMKTSS